MAAWADSFVVAWVCTIVLPSAKTASIDHDTTVSSNKNKAGRARVQHYAYLPMWSTIVLIQKLAA
jgi:hypothetical protein